MRGGTANCHVHISEQPVGSPLVAFPTILIAMNRPSLEKFERDVSPNGLVIYDSSLIDIVPSRKDINVLKIPATKMADELGNTRIANMVIFGAFVGYTQCLNIKTVEETLNLIITRKRLVNINQQAVNRGFDFGSNYHKNN
jgi:Pyruvate/2-oxoacid:ferredoxin oxidoreductase gamma subunit